jgi:hypothetical protein
MNRRNIHAQALREQSKPVRALISSGTQRNGKRKRKKRWDPCFLAPGAIHSVVGVMKKFHTSHPAVLLNANRPENKNIKI